MKVNRALRVSACRCVRGCSSIQNPAQKKRVAEDLINLEHRCFIWFFGKTPSLASRANVL
jgi:hypothetical protein